MIGKLKPYPKMKDSGLPWLGEVPAHWDLLPNRAMLNRRKVLVGERHGDYQLLSLTKQGVIVRDIDNGKGKFSADMGTCQEVRSGDLVFCLFDVPETPRTVGLSRHDGMITGAYTVFGCSDSLLAMFIDLFYRAMDDRKLLSPLYSGLRNTIPPPRFLGTKTPVPSPEEQTAIVRYLGYVDRRVGRYVRAKEKLIGLLEEQKQAIIHQAVTRGLNPNAPLKPSGIQWLGDVPEHWEVRRLKSLVSRIDQGISPQAENFLADDNTWGVLKAGCVNRGIFREVEHKRLPVNFTFDFDLAVAEGDVLVSRASGSPHLVGSVGRVLSLKYKLILSDKTFRPVFNHEVNTDFMVLAMNSRYYRQQVEQAISGAEGLANNLPLSSLRAFFFLVPPTEEQRRIIEYINKSTQKLLATIDRTRREIALLREYRTRLIADVVTGKLDVREVAAGLPEEFDEPEPLDLETINNDNLSDLDEERDE